MVQDFVHPQYVHHIQPETWHSGTWLRPGHHRLKPAIAVFSGDWGASVGNARKCKDFPKNRLSEWEILRSPSISLRKDHGRLDFLTEPVTILSENRHADVPANVASAEGIKAPRLHETRFLSWRVCMLPQMLPEPRCMAGKHGEAAIQGASNEQNPGSEKRCPERICEFDPTCRAKVPPRGATRRYPTRAPLLL